MSGKQKKAHKPSKKRKVLRPGGLKRPLSPYLEFIKERRLQVTEENSDISFGDLSKELGRMWKELDASSKSVYEERSKNNWKRYKEELRLLDVVCSSGNCINSDSSVAPTFDELADSSGEREGCGGHREVDGGN